MELAANPIEGLQSRQKNAAALLSAAWCLPAAAFAGFLSTRFGVWTVPSSTLLLLGSPAIVLVGRVLLWGWAFAALLEQVSLIRLAALGVFLDLPLLYAGRVSFYANPRFFLMEVITVGL